MEKLSIKKNYEIVGKISEGNFGTVFKAINKKTSKYNIIQIMNPTFLLIHFLLLLLMII